jgi:hypothetical protein
MLHQIPVDLHVGWHRNKQVDTIHLAQPDVLQRRKSAKEARAERKKARTGPAPFQVDSSLSEAMSSGKLTEAQVFEGQALTVLGTLFALSILEGSIIAASVRLKLPSHAVMPHSLQLTDLHRQVIFVFAFNLLPTQPQLCSCAASVQSSC